MLFADGAGAVVMAGPRAEPGADRANSTCSGRPPAIGEGHSTVLHQHAETMSWKITDAGFAMTLSPRTPNLLREMLLPVVEASERAVDAQFASFLVHPGGRQIIDAMDESLCLQGRAGIDHARTVMRRFGNMSSATLLFVAREALKQQCELPALMIAFGPGLTIEAIPLL